MKKPILMQDSQDINQARSFVGRMSRTSIGRVTGSFSRLFSTTGKIQATGQFLRRHLWAWPILAAVLFGGSGWWVHRSVEDAMRQQRANELLAILRADVTALYLWLEDQRSAAELLAQDEKLVPWARALLAIEKGKENVSRELLGADAQAALRGRLRDRLKSKGLAGFFLIAPSGVVLAADQDPPVGFKLGGYREAFLERVLARGADVCMPYRSPLLLADDHGNLRANLPTMLTAATLKDEDGKVLGILALRIRPDDQFTRILQVARFGETGETYAFDRNGVMVSQSRFDDELKGIGLLVDEPDSRSILTLQLRDPQVNMAAGERPALRRADQPLTSMAQQAIEGKDGYDVDGYRDYRGVPVVGAWAWLKEYDIGVATEMDVDEAFQPVYILRRAFLLLMTFLILCAAGIFAAMLFIARQQRAL